MKEAAKRGGAREGAGRKPTDPHQLRVAVPLRLPRWLVEWIDAYAIPYGSGITRADVIEAALLKAYKLRPPRAP